MKSYTKGLFSEWYVRQFLRLHGFEIIKNRHITGRHTGRAEIDIIARRGNLIIFCEVKNRKDAQTGLDAITWKQNVRLRRAAETYMRRTRWTGDVRFDCLVVSGWRIKWFKGVI
ncbi:MAG: YraN family protein [Alphaproteobacteria bacterium]|nr:YraN family protein [Alphaproteobacteria bacterium]